jgi:hypothetical protein
MMRIGAITDQNGVRRRARDGNAVHECGVVEVVDFVAWGRSRMARLFLRFLSVGVVVLTPTASGSTPTSPLPRDALGGFKHSGYGKGLSLYGLEDFTRIKRVMSNIEG